MEQKKSLSLPILILWILTILLVAVVPVLRPDGGINLDALIYFDMAEKLPRVTHNIYPIGYPLVLKIVNALIHDYYWTSKILSTLSIIAIGAFSIRKRFYVKPTIVLLSFKVFTMIFYYSLSETIFLPALYFLVYYIYAFFQGQMKAGKFVIVAGLLLFFLYTLRYNAIFICIGLACFYLVYSYRLDKFKTFFRNGFFYFLLLAAVLIGTYMAISLMQFPSLFGEDLRSEPMYKDGVLFTLLNIIGSVNLLNPVYSIKFDTLYGSRILLQGIISLIDATFLFIGIRVMYKNRTYFKNPFWLSLLVVSLVFFVCVFTVEYLNNIDPIYTRVVIVSSMFLMFTVLVMIQEQYPAKFKYAVAIGFFSIVFNFVFAVRKPVNFLAYREQVAKVLPTKPNALYFYDDTPEPVPTVYRIPFTNKSVSYIHAYYQPGYIHKYILMFEKPGIVPIEDIKGIDSSLIIFNSEIK